MSKEQLEEYIASTSGTDDIKRVNESLSKAMLVWKRINPKWFLHCEKELARISMIHAKGLFILAVNEASEYAFYVIPCEDVTKDPSKSLLSDCSVNEWDVGDVSGILIETLMYLLEYEDPSIRLHSAYSGGEGLVLSVDAAVDCEQFLKRLKQEYVIDTL